MAARSPEVPVQPAPVIPPVPARSPVQPSSFYRSSVWQFARGVARHLPRPALIALTGSCLTLYARLRRPRLAVVEENLLPVLDGNRAAAQTMARRMFHQFAAKLADLWHYEGGRSIDHLFGDLTGWENLTAALAQNRGVLLVTPHLGNWEFGAHLLKRRGIRLQVITLPEPDDSLTELRRSARALRGTETVALDQGPFAAVEIIRWLETNGCVALLMDRPPAATAVGVELFGHPFDASISAAELARATGCAIVPVYLPRERTGYVAHILPAVSYDRPALRDRAARVALTQDIMRAFEPAIGQYPDQWYHFVPIWPPASKP